MENETLSAKLDRIGACIEASYKDCRKCLKDLLQTSQIELDEMIRRNSKLKDIFDNSQHFMNDVLLEIRAILEDMQDVARNGVCSSNSSPSRNEPKSELFTI